VILLALRSVEVGLLEGHAGGALGNLKRIYGGHIVPEAIGDDGVADFDQLGGIAIGMTFPSFGGQINKVSSEIGTRNPVSTPQLQQGWLGFDLQQKFQFGSSEAVVGASHWCGVCSWDSPSFSEDLNFSLLKPDS